MRVLFARAALVAALLTAPRGGGAQADLLEAE